MNRRAQQPITIRSDRAAARLKLHTRYGRSQAAVIEEALERLPIPHDPDDIAARRARLEALIRLIPKGSVPSMEEFDRMEYDENGDLR